MRIFLNPVDHEYLTFEDFPSLLVFCEMFESFDFVVDGLHIQLVGFYIWHAAASRRWLEVGSELILEPGDWHWALVSRLLLVDQARGFRGQVVKTEVPAN